MSDFEFALKKSLLEEYKNSKGKPDEKTEKEINNLAEAIIKKEVFERLKKTSLKYFSTPPIVLIGFDVDRIKDYVFASSHPKEIRGSSAIIEEFTDTQLKDWIKNFVDKRHIIFAGGGSGIILAPRYQAEEIKKRIENKFHNIIDIDYIKSLNNKKCIPFGNIAEILGAKIRRAKNSKIREEFYSISGVLRRCTSCGVKPASCVDREHPDYTSKQPWKTAICESCAYKRKVGNEKKKEEFAAYSFHDLTEGYSKKYISVIYLDINKMGEVRENLETPEEYKEFSEIIKKTLTKAVDDVVKRKISRKYQSLVMGGDDLILILPAEEAPKMVERLIDFIDQKFKNPQGNVSKSLKEKLQNLTLATGFVIAPSHFPIKFLVNYAFDLLQETKRLSYIKGRHAVDFLILKDSSPLNTSIEEYIKTNYETAEICYTPRPYLFNDFKGNIEIISKIKSIPKTQLNIIKDLLLKESPRTALLNIRYQTVKMVDLWKNVLGNNIIKWSDFFLQRKDGRYVTKFIDLLELMEFGGQNET